MIHGIGIDCQGVAETRRSLSQFGERYLGRIFAPRELASITSSECLDPVKVSQLTSLFAAKEAIFKALRPPAHLTGGWSHIDVGQIANADEIWLSGKIREWSDSVNVTHLHLSFSSRDGFRLATAIAETSPVLCPHK